MTIQPQTFIVPRERDLIHPRFYTERVWKPARRHSSYVGGDRAWKKELTLIYEYDGLIFRSSGEPYDIPHVDDRMKWMGHFLKENEETGGPRSFSRVVDRLEMVYLYCKIRDQEIAAWDRTA